MVLNNDNKSVAANNALQITKLLSNLINQRFVVAGTMRDRKYLRDFVVRLLFKQFLGIEMKPD